MKEYTITVNGKTYDVAVEEKGASGAPMAAAPVAAAPAAAPAPAPAAGGRGSLEITAGAAGKVFKIVSNAGAKLEAGDTILVLEVMKMETPVVAPKAGTVVSIETSEGTQVEAGDLLATMNEA